MSEILIRPYAPDDLAPLVAINDAAYPAVPITPADEFAALVAHSALVLVAERDGAAVGFLLAMTPGLDYASENYRWFSARGDDFLYVDRIVLGSDARGLGAGRRLYQRVFEEARARGAAEVTCEVNVQPPNPESLAFHARLGFHELAQQPTKGGEVVVALLARPL
ncbi:GNAT family N-acetyltransferase [Protaetiibacter mangrovi]|uniref:GNAT family N-acetyltransferase n=1 Tax=Protaetiibacter mangrovi TaxID=2970926 RepID=A0ABT1ZIJ7_9MICO|nr:GNAT family N-acetyltransferase [Protaetiibacter mangrovi]MCS0500550.1 GNAT family N-acetyltransferase [Protaetiibacter mangrovi]